MDIDWSKAPEGATHYCMRDKAFWVQDATSVCSECIPRPERLHAEWNGEGLPPVGVECEFQPNFPEAWYVVEIVAHHDGSAVFIAEDDYPHGVYDGSACPESFRPIRTKEQRERDELSEVVAVACTLRAGIVLDEWQYGKIADAIIAAGWTKA